jgi:glycosyltransferase involved in cell wall biosynthesis
LKGTGLRALLVSARYFPHVGGVETHVYEVSRRLAANGVRTTILTTDPGGSLPKRDEIEGAEVVRVRSWPANRDYYFAPEIYRVIREGRWDVVNCSGYHTFVAPIAMLAAGNAGIPYVVGIHSGGHSSTVRGALRPAQQAMLRPLFAKAYRVTAVSAFEADLFRRRLRLSPDRIALVPNGSDLPKVQRRPPPTTRPLLVSVGRLEGYKGHQRVIRALPTVLARYPHARLIIVGSGPFERKLVELAGRLSVSGNVEITSIAGSDREGLARLLARASLLTLLSAYESQGLAAVEALAAGCPALVAHTSALAELAARGWAASVPLDASATAVGEAILHQLERPIVPGQVELPSWDECATTMHALLARAASRQSLGETLAGTSLTAG